MDLVRNDLGKISLIDSIKVPSLFNIESYKYVHQMVSTVISGLDTSLYDSLDTVEACFPPGSMTGAPKQRSVELLMSLEGYDKKQEKEDILDDDDDGDKERRGKRGVYSGTAGWISLNNCLDLNVIIRTAVFTGNRKQIYNS